MSSLRTVFKKLETSGEGTSIKDQKPSLNIDKIRKNAEASFVEGHTLRKEFKLQIEAIQKATDDTVFYDGATVSLTESSTSKLLKGIDNFPYHPDSNFTMNANKISGTNFIASKGPQDLIELNSFFENTAFNQKVQINKVVALGEKLVNEKYAEKDFYDYCLQPRKDEITQDYTFSIDVYAQKGTYNIKSYPSVNSETISKCYPQGIVQSNLLIHPKDKKENIQKLEVTLIELRDNGSIDLFTDEDNVKKDILWQIFQNAQKENVLIHCTAGIGRTGHLILTLEILKHYKDIFEAKDEEAAAKKINEIITRLRESRLCLIQVKSQLSMAITNAQILYQYGLKKNYFKDISTFDVLSVSDIDISEKIALNPTKERKQYYQSNITGIELSELKNPSEKVLNTLLKGIPEDATPFEDTAKNIINDASLWVPEKKIVIVGIMPTSETFSIKDAKIEDIQTIHPHSGDFRFPLEYSAFAKGYVSPMFKDKTKKEEKPLPSFFPPEDKSSVKPAGGKEKTSGRENIPKK